MTDVGPGTPLICVKYSSPSGESHCESADSSLTVDALYFCEDVVEAEYLFCPWDNCGTTGIALKGKGCACGRWLYCPNLFRPLNDGDTSLVKEEEEDLNLTGELIYV